MIYADALERGDGHGPATDDDGRAPRPFQIRGHLVHGIPQVGDSNYDPACPTCNPGSINDLGTPTAVVVTTTSTPTVVTTADAVPDPLPSTIDYSEERPLQAAVDGPLDVVPQQNGVINYY